MNVTLDSRDMNLLRRAMELYGKLMHKAANNNVRLKKNEEEELIGLTRIIHEKLYKAAASQ
jgi:hypothetical protein